MESQLVCDRAHENQVDGCLFGASSEVSVMLNNVQLSFREAAA